MKNDTYSPTVVNAQNGNIVLSSGKVIEASAGVIGLDHKGGVFHGYDGRLVDPDIDSEDEPLLTTDEKIELAELMIERWTAFRRSVQS
jgi:hypothetical protein